MKLIVVIPAYNEERTIERTISKLKKNGYRNILVVDDGSRDRTYEIAKKHCKVYRHIINRGLGGALNTGITAALMNKADIIVTFDADLQHDPRDIKKVVDPIINGKCDVVIGNRISNGMPLTRKIGNRGLDLITYLLFGFYVTDTQSGLRAFKREVASKLNLRTNRMEISSEIISEIGRNKLRLKQVKIKPIYTEYSLKKGENNMGNGFKILFKLILRRLM